MLAFTPLVTDGLISRRSSGYVSPRSSPLSSSTLWREVGIRRVQRPSQTRRCFEGVPPNPPPGFYGEGEWDDFNEEEKMSWNPLAIYQKYVTSHPILTKMVVGGFLTLLADLAAQYIEFRNSDAEVFKIDYRRAAALTGYLTLIGTPILHGWFATLERIFPGTVKFKALKQMIVDQAFFAVVFNAQLIFALDVLERGDVKKAYKKLTTVLPSILKANWKLWPFTQLVNFTLVPLQFRVLWTNFIAFGWTIILSTMAHE